MRENLDRVLQFMAAKKIRMHQITSREILEGNLKAVMRLILALAAHYKPASVKHHDVSTDNVVPDINTDTKTLEQGRDQGEIDMMVISALSSEQEIGLNSVKLDTLVLRSMKLIGISNSKL